MPLVAVRRCKAAQAEIELFYDTHGTLNADRSNCLVLVMGLNAQMIFWHDGIVSALVALGFYVVRFDNRDCGLSCHLDHMGSNSVCCLVCCCNCCAPAPSYTLNDMAEDAVALLDKLGIESAAWAGQSMGGMICQIVAAQRPDRCKSLALIYTTPGDPALPDPTCAIKLSLAAEPRDGSRQAYIDNMLTMSKAATFVPDCAFDKEWLSAFYGKIFDRSQYNDGLTRQGSAVARQRDRSALCRTIKAPTVVVHGELDELVPPVHGRRLAELIPGSKLVMLSDMGHGIMPVHVARVVAAIGENALRAARPGIPSPAAAAGGGAAAAAAAPSSPEPTTGDAAAVAPANPAANP